ncbi:MAG: HIT family protein [Steroidobacteraceae bacterium]
MSYDRNNVFARILRGELPCHKVCEDEHTLAFMDIMPQTPGHTLVIPRREARDLFELAPDALAATILTTQRVAQAVRQAFAPPGVMIAQFNGAAAGQTVFHLHFHVIPRYDGESLVLHGAKMGDSAVLAGYAERIRACLDR